MKRLIIGIAIGLVIGGLLVWFLFKSGKKDVVIEIDEQELRTVFSEIEATVEIIQDLNFPKSYTIRLPGSTIVIDSSTPYGDVPITKTTWEDSFDITIDDDHEKIYFTESIICKGRLGERTIWLHPTKFTKSTADPKTRFYGGIGGGYFKGGKVPLMGELGLLYKKRVSVSGIVLHLDDWYVGGMVRVWF